MGLVHPEGIYDDPNGFALRKEIYPRLKYHFQFVNVKKLFKEILHWVTYSVNIYSGTKGKIYFYSINNLFLPSTIEGSFINTHKKEPAKGLKFKNEQTNSFEWNTKPHPSRVVKIDEKILKILATTFEDSEDWEGTKLVSIHAQEMLSAITKIGLFQTNVSDYEHIVLEGWHETNDINKENIQRET